MRFIKYGYASFSKHIFTNIFIIFQLTFLFVGLNVVIGNFNSRNMLLEPFEEIIKNDGYYWTFSPVFFTYDKDMGSEMVDDDDERTSVDFYNETLASFKGDCKVYQVGQDTIIKESESQRSLKLVFVDDEIYEKFSFPLVSGSWKMSDSDKIYGVISPNTYGYKTGDTVNWNGKEIKISGMMTDPCYVPLLNSAKYSETESDISMFYVSSLKESAQYDYLILPKSAVGLTPPSSYSDGTYALLVFDPSLSKEDRAYNVSLINKSGGGISFEQIRKSTEIYVNEDTQKTIPLVVCIWIVSVVGLVCSSAITTLKLLRNYALYYVCGAKWRDCLLINAVSSLICIIISGFLAFLIMKMGFLNGLAQEIGFVFQRNNLIYTALLALLMVVLSVIVPALMLKRKQPKTVISEMSE